MKLRFGFLILAAVVFAACGGNSYKANPNFSPEANAGGKFVAANCMGCHSINGKDGAGPTLRGLAGSTVTLEDGSTVTADDAYLTTAIDDPDAQIVKGYHKGSMSAAFPKGSITPKQTAEIVAYLNTLK